MNYLDKENHKRLISGLIILVIIILLIGAFSYTLGKKGLFWKSSKNVFFPATTPSVATNSVDMRFAPPLVSSSISLKDKWFNYQFPGQYSFRYPGEAKALKETVDRTKIILPFNIDQYNYDNVSIEKVTGNIYNRPFEQYIYDINYNTFNLEKIKIAGLPALRLENDRYGQEIYVLNGNDIYYINFHNLSGEVKSTDLFYQILSTLFFEPYMEITSGVKVKDGDIFVVNNGVEKKITDWKYNFNPVLSLDGSKIAFLSKTK